MTVIDAYWCRTPSRPNFGDALTPWLVHRISGRYPRYVPHDDPRPKTFVTGSVAALAAPGDTVWGCGIMNHDDVLSPAARWLAVRGPRTRNRALACGAICPAVYGDPALLLPRLYAPLVDSRSGIGLVAHFADQARLRRSDVAANGLELIDIQDPITDVIDRITHCEWVMASSLHGLIAAHAYSVPALRVRLWELPSGDGSKFIDHYEALDHEAAPARTIRLDEPLRFRDLERLAWCPQSIDTEPLWRSCPFRDHER